MGNPLSTTRGKSIRISRLTETALDTLKTTGKSYDSAIQELIKGDLRKPKKKKRIFNFDTLAELGF